MKKMVRQCHEDIKQLTESWNTVMVKMGQTKDCEFSTSLLYVTALINAQGCSADELRTTLEWLKKNKWSNSFIKTICLVAHKLIEQASTVLAAKHGRDSTTLQCEPILLFIAGARWQGAVC